MKKYSEDDRFTVPEDIKRMTSEERRAEIARLEKEIKERKRSSGAKIARTVSI